MYILPPPAQPYQQPPPPRPDELYQPQGMEDLPQTSSQTYSWKPNPKLNRKDGYQKSGPRRKKNEPEEEQDDEETRKMKMMMGIEGFDTSKDKKHAGPKGYVAKVQKPARYRQYMNRRGGFNRPLDYVQ